MQFTRTVRSQEHAVHKTNNTIIRTSDSIFTQTLLNCHNQSNVLHTCQTESTERSLYVAAIRGSLWTSHGNWSMRRRGSHPVVVFYIFSFIFDNFSCPHTWRFAQPRVQTCLHSLVSPQVRPYTRSHSLVHFHLLAWINLRIQQISFWIPRIL
jgi:hypothetical protein